MSQQATGTGITQISVSASSNVNIRINGQTAVQLVAPAFPRPFPEERQEIDLLKAAYAANPFIGRDETLQDFLAWCAGDRPVSMRTLVGQGGAGKTRFAYELYAHIRKQPDWAAYFLRFLKEEAKEVDLCEEIRSPNALLIAEYASDHPKPLADLLQSLTDFAPEGRRIRVLLLARTADWDHGWLAGLRSGRTGEEVDRLFHPRKPLELPAFTPEDRQKIFEATLAQVARFSGKVPPALPSTDMFARKEVAERPADPLTLMMAAVTALHDGTTRALTLNRTELALEVSHKLVAERMKRSVSDHTDLFLHMAAYATLCGGLQREQALQILEEESAATYLGRVADPAAFLDRLQAWLPGEISSGQKTWLGTIQPDIVGEAFLLGPGSSGQAGNSYLLGGKDAVLRAAKHRAGPTTKTIIRAAQDFSGAPAHPRSEPLQWLESIIKSGEADDDIRLLINVSDAMPHSSVLLREAGLRISREVCARLRIWFENVEESNLIPAQSLVALSLNTLANRQSAMGQREAALATAQEAAELRRELVRGNRDAFLSDLARSLNNLATFQSEMGQREAALATAQEAAELRRELVRGNRDAFLSDLARSLNNLANRQSAMGQREAALATAQEAAELRRELVRGNWDAFLSDLARSLNNLATFQSEMGQREAALATAQEAAELRRELVRGNRDAFIADYARTHGVLGNALHALTRNQEAVSAFEEGVRSILPEVMKYPAAHLPLALTLVRLYVEVLQSVQSEPDEMLSQEIMRVLGPYLSQEGNES